MFDSEVYNEDDILKQLGTWESPIRKTLPELEEYKRYLGTQPKLSEYQPSRTRSIMSKIAGGFVGAFQGPQAGIETNQNITMSPYRRSVAEFEQGLTPRRYAAEQALKMEDERRKQEETSARTAELTSRSGRNVSQGNYYEHRANTPVPFAPTDEAGYLRVHPPAPVVAPTTSDVIDRTTGKVLRPGVAKPLEVYQGSAKEAQDKLRSQLRQHEIRLRHSLATKASKMPTVQSKAQAEQLAFLQVIREHPEYLENKLITISPDLKNYVPANSQDGRRIYDIVRGRADQLLKQYSSTPTSQYEIVQEEDEN